MKNLINREANSHGSTLMQMNVECVMDCLNSEGIVYTVRGYKMSNGKVSINGSLLCDRVSVKKVASKDDLINFVKYSGFKSVDDWWDKIRMFVKDDREMWLYKVTTSTSPHKSPIQSTMVGIVGSRSRDDRQSAVDLVDLVYSLPNNSTIVSGGCRGPDTWAAKAARKRGLKVIEFFPDLSGNLTYIEATQRYYDRNQKIAEACDVLHAFVSDKRIGGTENTIKHAERLHKQVVIHLPEIDKEKQQETKHNFSSNKQIKPKMVTTPHPAVRRTDNLNSPEFISELKENDVFVFGSNLGGFHGAGSAGYAMRGTTSNTWRSDKTFLSALNGSDKRGTWAVLGKGIGFQTGKSGSSYAVPTVERPGVKGRVDLEFFRKQLITFCTFAGAHPELRFLVVKLGATRDEGGFSYLGSGNVKSCWESIHKLTGIPDNILLPKEHNPRQDKEKQQETKHNLFSSNKQIKPKMVAKTNVETNHTDNKPNDGFLVLSEYTDPCFHPQETKQKVDAHTGPLYFITKDPRPLLSIIEANKHRCLVHVTVTGMGSSAIEPNVPTPDEIEPAIATLSTILPKGQLVIRIDPIIFGANAESANTILKQFAPYTNRFRISYCSLYPFVRQRLRTTGITLNSEQFHYSPALIRTHSDDMTNTANHLGITIEYCAPLPAVDQALNKQIKRIACVSAQEYESLGFQPTQSSHTQRQHCHCLAKTEALPQHKSCQHNCLYCYFSKDRSMEIQTIQTKTPKMVTKTNVETNHTNNDKHIVCKVFDPDTGTRKGVTQKEFDKMNEEHDREEEEIATGAYLLPFTPPADPFLDTLEMEFPKEANEDTKTHAAVQTIVELFKEPELGTTTPKQIPKAKPTPLEDIKSILAKHGSFHKRPIRMQRTAPNTYSVISGHLTLRSCLSEEEASLYIHHLTTPTPRTNAELETIENAIYNNPNKPRRHKPAKQFVPNKQALCLLPGVRNAWTHRGKLCIAILNDYKQDFLNTMSIDFEQTSRMGPTSVLKSKETICPVASMKQRFAADAKEARLDDTHLGVFRNTRYSRILDLLEAYGSDSLPEGMVHIDERYELEDELDVVPNSLIVEEGMQGFHYKEDYDLERAQKTEHQIQMRANIINYKEFLRDRAVESRNPILVV